MTNLVTFLSYYAQCFYLVTLFLHDPSHDFLSEGNKIDAYESSPSLHQKEVISHGKKGGGKAEKMTVQESWQFVLSEIGNNIDLPYGPLSVIKYMKQNRTVFQCFSETSRQIVRNYLLTYDTIDNLHGSFFVEDQLFQRIGNQTGLNCAIGSTCLINIKEISSHLSDEKYGIFKEYNGIVASNGNFFLPVNNSITVANFKDSMGDAILVRIDLGVQNVPLTNTKEGNFWNIIIRNIDKDINNITQGYESIDGPGLIPQPVVLQIISADLWFEKKSLYAMRCGIQALLSTWLRVEIAFEQINNVSTLESPITQESFDKIGQKQLQLGQQKTQQQQHIQQKGEELKELIGNKQRLQEMENKFNSLTQEIHELHENHKVWTQSNARTYVTNSLVDVKDEGMRNLRESTNYYTRCVLNDQCTTKVNIGGHNETKMEGGSRIMSGGMSDVVREKVKISYSWYVAVALNSVYFPLKKTLPTATAPIDAIQVEKFLLNESLKIILPLVRMGLKTKKIKKGKGGIDKQLIEKFKRVVCDCSIDTCPEQGTILQSKSIEQIPDVCKYTKDSGKSYLGKAANEVGSFYNVLKNAKRDDCNRRPCGATVPELSETIGTYFGGLAVNGKKFLINNALSTKSNYIPQSNKFCPVSSIFDPMSMCSSGKLPENGVEMGNMDVTIQYKNNNGIISSYRLKMDKKIDRNQVNQVDPQHEDWTFSNVGFRITADLKIGDEKLLDNLVMDIEPYNKWGRGGMFGAAKTLMKLGQIVDRMNVTHFRGKSYVDQMNVTHFRGNKSLRKLYNFVGSDAAGAAEARSSIVGVLFKKGLGDNLQELNGVISNGGYVGLIENTKDTIISPQDGRMMLGTDQPSAVRAMFLLVMGQGAINPKAVAGYVAANGEYILAARANNNFAQGGGAKKIHKRTRRRKSKSKKKYKKIRKHKKRKKTRKRKKRKKKTKIRK